MSHSIAIIGAGLLGRLLSWRLLRRDHRVTLFEAGQLDQPRCAAHTAAAMISPLSEAVVSNTRIYQIGLHSLSLWPQWIKELNSASCGNHIAYANPGTLAVAHPQDHAELRQFKQDLQNILKSEDTSTWLEREDIQAREADLAQFHSALYLPGEAYLDNRQLLKSLLENILALGGQCRDKYPVMDCNQSTDKFNLQSYDYVVDCRGIGAKRDCPGLRGVRGEVMWVHCPDVQFRHAIRLMHPRYKLYVVPKPDHHYIIGATEIESEDLSPISVQSMLELASALYTIHPAFAEARVVETDVNLRPAFVDNEPKVLMQDKVIRVNGLHRHGYLLAPTIVNDITAWISGDNPGQFWSYYQ